METNTSREQAKLARLASIARSKAMAKAIAARVAWLRKKASEPLEPPAPQGEAAWRQAMDVERQEEGLAGLRRIFDGLDGAALARESLGSSGSASQTLWAHGDCAGGWLAFWAAGGAQPRAIEQAAEAARFAMNARRQRAWPWSPWDEEGREVAALDLALELALWTRPKGQSVAALASGARQALSDNEFVGLGEQARLGAFICKLEGLEIEQGLAGACPAASRPRL